LARPPRKAEINHIVRAIVLPHSAVLCDFGSATVVPVYTAVKKASVSIKRVLRRRIGAVCTECACARHIVFIECPALPNPFSRHSRDGIFARAVRILPTVVVRITVDQSEDDRRRKLCTIGG